MYLKYVENMRRLENRNCTNFLLFDLFCKKIFAELISDTGQLNS